MPVSDPDVSRPRLIHAASFLEAGRREIATNLVGALAESMTIWSAPRELESYFPRISTGRSAGFMFTRASSNSFGGT